MRNRIFRARTLAVLLALTACRIASAGGVSAIQLTSMRPILLADGKQSTDITAKLITDASGRVGSNVMVSFSTDRGQLSQTQAFTDFSGTARVRLTSAPNPGTAHVTANAPGSTPGSIEIEFTDDPSALYLGNNYMSFAAKTYLAYSATERVIEGEGANGGAHLTFRNFDVIADRLQFRCDDGILRAQGNVVMKRAGDKLNANRVYYSMVSGEGWAVTREADGSSKSVKIFGPRLRTEEQKAPPPISYMQFPNLQVKLVIVAVSITYFPNQKLQFRRPKFYQDSARIMSMAYYELPLHSDQLFTDQFISVGTSGLGLQLPYYYNLTPTRSGEILLWRQQQIGRGYYATDPGWGIDIVQGYNSQGEHKYEGAYGFTGLTRDDWDFRWNHSQEFNSTTQGSFDFETPDHNSLYGDTNLTQQFSIFRWGANISAGRSFASDQSLATNANIYLETQPKPLLANKSLLYTIGTTFLSAHDQSLDSDIQSASETREGINLHVFSRPLQLNKTTTFTDSITVGNTWAGHEGEGLTSLATLALDHQLRGGGTVNLTYDLVYQPASFIDTTGRHRLSASYTYNKSKKLSITIFGSAYLDYNDSSLLADITYRVNGRWRLIGQATLESDDGLTYTDYELTLGRRIGARELQLTYSTFLKRISLDFTATRF